jgi:hypothetical protein
MKVAAFGKYVGAQHLTQWYTHRHFAGTDLAPNLMHRSVL